MRQRTADWFETKIRYDKTMDDGMLKPITEQYVVDALSFTEAENAIIEEMSAFIAGDFKITGIKPAPYHEVFFSENDNDDKWYKAKLQFITLDEKTEHMATMGKTVANDKPEYEEDPKSTKEAE